MWGGWGDKEVWSEWVGTFHAKSLQKCGLGRKIEKVGEIIVLVSFWEVSAFEPNFLATQA